MKLRPVVLAVSFAHYRLLLLALWLSVALWIAAFFVRTSLNSTAHGAALLLSIGIILGVLMPNGIKESFKSAIQTDEVAGEMSIAPNHLNDTQFFKMTPSLPNPDAFKAGHFVLFALLTIVLVSARPYKLSTNSLVFYLCLFAGVTEISQLFVPGRSAQLGDIAIDCGGIATGLILSGLRQLYIHRGNGFPPKTFKNT